MKVRIHKNRRTRQMTANYYHVSGKTRFRRCLLQKVLAQTSADVMLIIDTNQRIGPGGAADAAAVLTAEGFESVVMPIPANPQQLFGISFKVQKNKTNEKLIVIDLKKRIPGGAAFDVLLNYDIALGFGSEKTLPEVCDALCAGAPLFGAECFSHSLYDSILCTSVRSSFDIRKQIKETSDEMGL